jgi:predicted dehydrogenase
MTDLRQAWPAPAAPRPIVIVGAGAIGRAAHLPAYRRLQLSNLQRFVAGEDTALVSPVTDAIRTIALVEACSASSEAGLTPIPAA